MAADRIDRPAFHKEADLPDAFDFRQGADDSVDHHQFIVGTLSVGSEGFVEVDRRQVSLDLDPQDFCTLREYVHQLLRSRRRIDQGVQGRLRQGLRPRRVFHDFRNQVRVPIFLDPVHGHLDPFEVRVDLVRQTWRLSGHIGDAARRPCPLFRLDTAAQEQCQDKHQ